MLAVGILLAVAAGMMALELASVMAFLAGGVGAWLAVQWVLPQAQELWAVFLSGGLFGLLLYRLWTMLLTSLIGTLLAGARRPPPARAGDSSSTPRRGPRRNVAALNGAVVAFAVLGLLLQVAACPDPEGKAEEEDKEEDHGKKKGHGHHDHHDDHGHDDHGPRRRRPPRPGCRAPGVLPRKVLPFGR